MFDNICKFLAENFSNDFAQWIFGRPMGLTKMSPNELALEPIRADALILLQSQNVVLHLEFQTVPNKEIPLRMTNYYLRIYNKHAHKHIKQVVVYLTPSGSNLVQQNTFTTGKLRHEFDVVRLWEQPASELLKYPGLLPLAVLGRTTNKTQTLQAVGARINTINNRKEQSNIAAATSILAGLVLDKDTIRSVLREEIMQESVIYQDIIEQGVKKGREEGREEGRQKTATLVLRQLKHQFGEIESTDETKIANLSAEQLSALGEALLDFKSRDDLNAWLSNI